MLLRSAGGATLVATTAGGGAVGLRYSAERRRWLGRLTDLDGLADVEVGADLGDDEEEQEEDDDDDDDDDGGRRGGGTTRRIARIRPVPKVIDVVDEAGDPMLAQMRLQSGASSTPYLDALSKAREKGQGELAALAKARSWGRWKECAAVLAEGLARGDLRWKNADWTADSAVARTPREDAVSAEAGPASAAAGPVPAAPRSMYSQFLGGGSRRNRWSVGELGRPTYLDSMAAEGGPAASRGVRATSYLDAIGEVCMARAAAAGPSGADLDADGGGDTNLDGAASPAAPTAECAYAITDYLDALSLGSVQPTGFASAGISSYLDTLTGGGGRPGAAPTNAGAARRPGQSSPIAAVSDYLDSISSGEVEAPSISQMKGYLDALAGGDEPSPVTASSIVSYVDSPEMDSAVTTSATYVAAYSAETSGTSYLDTINEVCEPISATASLGDGAGPSPECAYAITDYLDALSIGVVQPTRLASAGIGSYLDTISGGAAVSAGGSGVQSYTDTVGSSGAIEFSAAPTSVSVTLSLCNDPDAIAAYKDAASSHSTSIKYIPEKDGTYTKEETTRLEFPSSIGSTKEDVVSYLNGVANGFIPAPVAGIDGSVSLSSTSEEIAAYKDAALSETKSVNIVEEGDGTFTRREITHLEFPSMYTDDIENGTSSGLSADIVESYLGYVSKAGPSKVPSETSEAESTLSSFFNGGGTESAVSSFLNGIASGAFVAPSADSVHTYLGDIVNGKVSLPSSSNAIASYMDGASDQEPGIDGGSFEKRPIEAVCIEDGEVKLKVINVNARNP